MARSHFLGLMLYSSENVKDIFYGRQLKDIKAQWVGGTAELWRMEWLLLVKKMSCRQHYPPTNIWLLLRTKRCLVFSCTLNGNIPLEHCLVLFQCCMIVFSCSRLMLIFCKYCVIEKHLYSHPARLFVALSVSNVYGCVCYNTAKPLVYLMCRYPEVKQGHSLR